MLHLPSAPLLPHPHLRRLPRHTPRHRHCAWSTGTKGGWVTNRAGRLTDTVGICTIWSCTRGVECGKAWVIVGIATDIQAGKPARCSTEALTSERVTVMGKCYKLTRCYAG